MAEVKEMSEKQVINIDSNDIERVKKFRNEYAEVTARIGEVEVERLNLELMLANIDSVKDNLSQKFSSLRNEEQNITKEFTEKYGNGEFDMENGTFTPIS
tara:strand:+ start:1342 stop:1641 length:300 start_codon:yes stop_codon:yes gene_type:complete